MRRKLGAGRKVTKEPVSLKAAKLGARIKKTRKTQGYRLTDIEKRLGITHQALSNIENGITNPDDARARRTIQKLAELLDDDFGLPWVTLKSDQSRDIRIEGKVAAGKPLEFYDGDEIISIDPNFIRASGDLMALRVSGESMLSNHILPQDVLICRRAAEPRRHSITVVELKGERGATVKRWERKSEEDVILCADFDDPKAERQQVKTYFIGKVFEVVGLVRRLT